MARTLFVHVGPKKTATTSIQDFFRTHDNSVVIYPKLASGAAAHHRLVSDFFSMRRNGAGSEDLQRLFGEVAAQTADSDKNVLISSEALEVGNRDIGEFVRALLPYVGRSRAEVELIMVCREHFARASSWYNHYVRSWNGRGERRELPDEFLKANVANICYAGFVRRLRQSGFKITALNYHPSADWTDRFFRYIGFPEEKLPRLGMKLLALSPKVLIASVGARRTVSSKELGIQLQRAFMKMREAQSPSKFIFGRRAAEYAERQFREDRELLLQEFAIEISARELASEKNGFCIDTPELEEIKEVALKFGPEGDKIVRFARRFVRSADRPT